MTKRDPSRGVGWGAGWQPPIQGSNSTPPTEPYSYIKESPGYARYVLEQAQKALGRKGTDFSDLFIVGPLLGAAETYRRSLNINELATLKEISETPPAALRELKIVGKQEESS